VSQYVSALKEIPSFERVDFVAVGKKGQQFLARMGLNVVAAFGAMSNHPTYKDIYPLSRMASEGFLKGEYDQVTVIYADFISALSQMPVARVLLPLSQEDLRIVLQGMQSRGDREIFQKLEEEDVKEYKFEPSQEEVLKLIIPQLTEVQLYQAVLEATASEHSARMVAMRNATDNASELIDDLTLTYNQTRQANITAELAELSASKAALES
jgi:F-type H+-transporting ATPase subunit gamma